MNKRARLGEGEREVCIKVRGFTIMNSLDSLGFEARRALLGIVPRTFS